MTREQDNEIERLSLAHGGQSLAIREGFADGHVDVTLPGGRSWTISEHGVAQDTHPNHSIRWEQA